jgi:integrase
MGSGHLQLASRKIAPAQGLGEPGSARRFRFTETELGKRTLPAKGAVVYHDDQIPGFVCRCTPTARTLYVVRRRRGAGKLIWHRLGVVGDKPLAEYRIAAQTASAALAAGQEPTTTIAKRGALTLGRALEDYLEAKGDTLAAGTVKAYRADFEAFAEAWRSRALTGITPAEVAKRHQERSAESPSRADGALRVLRAVERYAKAAAAARGEALNTDLLAMVRAGRTWNNVARRSSYLDNGRRAAWIAAVTALPDDAGNKRTGTQRDALLLIAATGLRLREALHLAWDEVNLKAATLTLAAERMKGGRAHTLPIPRRTLAMLKARRAADPDGAYVFPGPVRDDDGNYLPLDRISRQTFALIGVTFTPHDLRRTVASWLGANAPSYVVKQVLSHSDPSKSADVTLGYVNLTADDLRPWLQRQETALHAKPTKRTRRNG